MQIAIIVLKLSYSSANVQAMHGNGGKRLTISDLKTGHNTARYSVAQGTDGSVSDQVCSFLFVGYWWYTMCQCVCVCITMQTRIV